MGQGIAALQILNLLEGFDLRAMGFNSTAALHTMIEAKKNRRGPIAQNTMLTQRSRRFR
jgi:gamma-glutamyltranspeptidase